MRKILLPLFTAVLLLGSSSAVMAKKDDGSQVQPDNYYPRVKIETTMGDVVVELDRRRAPITVNNFLRYVDNAPMKTLFFIALCQGLLYKAADILPISTENQISQISLTNRVTG